MTDHADTIRDALDLVAAEKPWTTQDARTALDALLAERQQLQEERDALIRTLDCLLPGLEAESDA